MDRSCVCWRGGEMGFTESFGGFFSPFPCPFFFFLFSIFALHLTPPPNKSSWGRGGGSKQTSFEMGGRKRFVCAPPLSP